MTGVGAAETNSIRLAIGPFFAPAGNMSLEKAASELPDLLTASLSQQNRFQLVEREKVNAIWNEMHLAEAGLMSADTVGKLGRILSCDWLVSGSFVQTGSGTQIWVKVINTQDSVVLDLQAVPYNGTNFSATADAIAKFLAQTGSRSRPREFMAMGKFEDMSLSSTREDWSPRLAALIEKHFLAAGYGIVEREAMGPIFAEYQLQTAGLTGDSTNQVKLKPAFWIVDGKCKWIYDTQDKLSVTIRIQKVGGGEQEFSFTQPPGDDLEKAVVEAIQSALTNANSMTLEQAQKEEGKIRSGHVGELVKGRGETPPLRYSTNQTFITVTDAYGGKRQLTVDPAFLAQRESHAREMLKTLQQAILLNPKDMRSKWALRMSLYCMNDPVEKQQGQELLEEVAASDDVTNATKAKNWLADFKSGRLTLEPDRLGNLAIVTHGQPASIPQASGLSPERTAQLQAQAAKRMEITNVAVRSEHPVPITQNPEVIAYLDDGPITAYSEGGRALGKGPLLVACGMTLKSFNWTGIFGFGSGTDFEKVDLPLKMEHAITAITLDKSDVWLGTDGGGLIKIPQSGGTPTIFGEKDGFPMSSIRSLARVPGRLFIGFGRGKDGALGYLDTTTLKFTGMMSPVTTFKTGEEALQPPPRHSVWQIKSPDETNTYWIASDPALYRLKFDSQQWSLQLPTHDQPDYPRVGGFRTLSTSSNFVATIISTGGVGICKLPEDQWTHLNLSTNQAENHVTTLAMDSDKPNYLWLGSRGKITILDMNTQEIVCQCRIPRPGAIEFMIIYSGDIFFIGDDQISGSYELYHMKKPKF